MQLFFKADIIAELRAKGGWRDPAPTIVAALAELEGIHGVSVHLHEEETAIKRRDVEVMLDTLSIPVNVEMSPSMKNKQIAFDAKPPFVTLITDGKDPMKRREPLSASDREAAGGFIAALNDAEITSAVFIKPDLELVRWAHRHDAEIITIDTWGYALAKTDYDRAELLGRVINCANLASRLGMRTHIGGGINFHNVAEIVRQPFQTVHIGQAIIARGVMIGMSKAIENMLTILEKGVSLP